MACNCSRSDRNCSLCRGGEPLSEQERNIEIIRMLREMAAIVQEHKAAGLLPWYRGSSTKKEEVNA